MQNYKRDAIFSIICGELTAIFLLSIIKNPYVPEFAVLAKFADISVLLLIIFPVLFLAGIVIGRFLSKFMGVFFQIVKFVEVGALNTIVDFGILNLLMSITGATAGAGLVPLNTVSFSVAVINSYFWNKTWTFKTEGQVAAKSFLQFLVVSAIGWGINTGIVYLGTTFFSSGAVSAGAWANIIKLLATFASMVWNFIGYKFIVFKK